MERGLQSGAQALVLGAALDGIADGLDQHAETQIFQMKIADFKPTLRNTSGHFWSLPNGSGTVERLWCCAVKPE